jgi:uncharacterized protein YndB with AHSA1/START domain
VVWRWLADRDAMAQWLMPNDFEPRVGHQFTFRTKPAPGFDGIVHCRVLEVDPPRRLAFTWAGGGIDTVVTFTLEADGSGTVLRLTHAGFSGPKGVLLSYMLGNGWKGMLTRKLPKLLERPAGSERPVPAASGCEEKTRFWRWFDRLSSRR